MNNSNQQQGEWKQVTDTVKYPFASLRITPTNERGTIATLREFEVQGNLKRRVVYSFLEAMDAIDGVFYFIEGKTQRPKILAYQTLRIPVAIPQGGLSAPLEVDADEAVMWNLPGTYIRLDKGIHSVKKAAAALAEKLGVTPVGALQHLGGNYFPSAGGSTEFVFVGAQQVAEPEFHSMSKFGEAHASICHTKYFYLQEVLDGYLDGSIRDTRLVLATLRLADLLGVKLDVDLGLQAPDWSGECKQIEYRSLDTRSLTNLIQAFGKGAAVTEVTERRSDFLQHRTYSVQNLAVDGEPLGEPYPLETVERKYPNSVDVCAYGAHRGQLFISFKVDERSVCKARNTRQHAGNSGDSSVCVEPIARSLRFGDEESQILEVALDGMKVESGITAQWDQAKIVAEEYPSPGVHPEKVFRVMVPVAAEAETFDPYELDVIAAGFMEVDELIRLCNLGKIRDPRLEISARLLRQHFNYVDPYLSLSNASTELKNEFVGVLAQGSKLQEMLSSDPIVAEVDYQLSSAEIYRKQKTLMANTLGLSLMEEATHPDDENAFSPLIARFFVPFMDDPAKKPFYSTHDGHHHVLGDVLPVIRDRDGRLKLVPLEVYRKYASAQECRAVWYSDILIPQVIGFERAREIFGNYSTAEAFQDLGISDEMAAEVVLSVERDGIIPDFVLEKLQLPEYEKYESLFVGRMLRYHLMDSAQIEVVYEHWVKNFELIEDVLQFTTAGYSDDSYLARFDEVLAQIRNPDTIEGFNPLKEELSTLINVRIRSLALRLAVNREIIRQEDLLGAVKAIAQIDDTLAQLKKVYDQTELVRDSIEDAEPSEENFAAFLYLRQMEAQVLPAVDEFFASLERNEEFLKNDRFKTNVGRFFSICPPVNQLIKVILPDEELKLKVEAMYQQMLADYSGRKG